MIIDSNNGNNQNNLSNQPNFASNFDSRLNTIKENYENNPGLIEMKESTRNMKYTDVNSTNDIKNKTFAMLQDRLANGTITIEEFKKKCNALGKIQNK